MRPKPGRFVEWKCSATGVVFGPEWDYHNGKNMPDRCDKAVMEGGAK